ncbi:MAG TPA: glycoside hydrolase family 9 protein [Polyangia bacterium]|nr:glycoside hydrolase family 9 protein [Polyangia bacterium]
MGGWHDAGDYGKYVNNGAFSAGMLLAAWEHFQPTLENGSSSPVRYLSESASCWWQAPCCQVSPPIVIFTAVPQRWPYIPVIALVSAPARTSGPIWNGADCAVSSEPSAGTSR